VIPTRSSRATTAEQWRSRLLDLHADDPPQILQILKDSAPPVGAWPLTDLASIPTWHTNRVCLVGDAAHATSPSAGQGASLALEDAVVLAHQMAAHGDERRALAAFETRRRPRVESLIRLARRNSNTKTPGPIAGLFRDLLLPVLLRAEHTAIGKHAYTYQPPTLENIPSACLRRGRGRPSRQVCPAPRAFPTSWRHPLRLTEEGVPLSASAMGLDRAVDHA
jgi:2-polyprenyl-6-methoxyphenol hydroxylase-like FAD-dependent oxidoreductase